MLNQETFEKLHQMRLGAMARALREQMDTPTADRLLREARFRLPACPEDIDWRHPRGLDRGLLRSLVGGDWLGEGRNVIITGPTGVGKTYVACALGNAAAGRAAGSATTRLRGWPGTGVRRRGPGSTRGRGRSNHDPLHHCGQPAAA